MDLKKGLSSGYCCLVLQDVDREDAAPSASVRMQVPTCVKHCETLYFTVFEDVFEDVFMRFTSFQDDALASHEASDLDWKIGAPRRFASRRGRWSRCERPSAMTLALCEAN